MEHIKFWLLVILGFAMGIELNITLVPISLIFPELSSVISMMGLIVINILIVKYFTEKHNKKIRENN
jgi:hypothetical protein